MDDRKFKGLPLARRTAAFWLPVIERYYRAKYKGLENVPDTPFLGVGNHLGVYFMPEAFLWMGKCHTMKNKPPMRVLVHKVLREMADLINFPGKKYGLMEASHENAIKAFGIGSAVTVYPGGDRENSKAWADRNKIEFFGHTGFVKLAIKAGVPIVPIVGCGGGETLYVATSGEKFAEKSGLTKILKVHTWPVYWSFPFGWKVGHFPYPSIPIPSQVTLSVLPHIDFSEYTEEDTKNEELMQELALKVEAIMQQEMDQLANGRIPVIGKLFDRD